MDELLTIKLDKDLIDDAENVLDNIGLDFQAVVKMLLKRVVKEGGISFLLPNNNEAKPPVVLENHSREKVVFSNNQNLSRQSNQYDYTTQQSEKERMTKNMAIRLFRSRGANFTGNTTFASKNRGAYNYWANPEFDMLKNDWYIILNDWKRNKLYLFFIPANSIKQNELIARNDKHYTIDLQICYDDITFSDTRSGYSFAKFKIDETQY